LTVDAWRDGKVIVADAPTGTGTGKPVSQPYSHSSPMRTTTDTRRAARIVSGPGVERSATDRLCGLIDAGITLASELSLDAAFERLLQTAAR
jgi:hypothetical protein